jgi:hypothetical protein
MSSGRRGEGATTTMGRRVRGGTVRAWGGELRRAQGGELGTGSPPALEAVVGGRMVGGGGGR